MSYRELRDVCKGQGHLREHDTEMPSSITFRNAVAEAVGGNVGSPRQYSAIKLALVDAITARH